MLLGLKKITKKNPIEKAVLHTPPNLTGGIYLYGRIGGGKSCGMISLAQKYHDHPARNYKIFHLYGGDRNEQLYWTLPSIRNKYWSKVKHVLNLKNEGSKQYKVNLLYPMSRNIRKKLPDNSPFVKSRIFTIPIKSIEIEDISLCIGSVAQTAEYQWRDVLLQLKNKDNGARLDYLFNHKFKAINTILYNNFVRPLVHHRLLQSAGCSFNLDLIEEMKDKETITVLCLDGIEKEYRLFVLGWILRQIAILIDNGKIHRKNILLIQEAAEFFRATDDSVSPDRYKIFRKMLAHYVRMGRRGMHLFMDAQSPSETKGMVDGSQDLTIFGRLVSEADKDAGTKQLFKDGFITKRQIQDLSVLRPGEYYFFESGKKVRKVYLLLPRTMFWESGFGNFYDHIWKRLVNKWKNISLDAEELETEFKQSFAKIKEEIKAEEDLKRKEIETKEQEKESKKEKKRGKNKVRVREEAIVSNAIESNKPLAIEL